MRNGADQSEKPGRFRRWIHLPAPLVLGIGVALIAVGWRVMWEIKHPAAAVARKIQQADAGGRLLVIRELEEQSRVDPEVAIPAIVVGLNDQDARVRAAAAMAVASATSTAAIDESAHGAVRAAVRALMDSALDREAAVRAAAVQSLWMVTLTWSGPAGLIDRARVFEALKQAAEDQDGSVRLAALRGIGTVGPRVVDVPPDVLVAALEDESEQNRAAAAYALVDFRRELPRLVPSLVRSLERARPEKRAKYLEVLGAIRAPRYSANAVAPLIGVLGSGDHAVRALAASSLSTYKGQARDIVPALIKLLGESRGSRPVGPQSSQPTSIDAVAAATEALGQLAPPTEYAGEAIKALANVLTSGSARQRVAAATALGQFPPDPFLSTGPGRAAEPYADPVQLAALTGSLSDADVSVRVASLRAVHDVGMKTGLEASPQLQAALAAEMEDESPEVRTQAAAAINHSGRFIDRLFPVVVRHAGHDPDKNVRELCAAVVSLNSDDAGHGTPSVTAAMIPVLIEALASRERELRRAACHSLARFGPEARPAIPALVRLVQESADSNDVPDEAADLLARLARATPHAADVIAVFVTLLSRNTAELQRIAAQALGAFGPSAAPAVPALAQTLRDTLDRKAVEPAVWMTAALAQIDPTAPAAIEAIPCLIEALGSERPYLRGDAALALGHFGSAAVDAVPALTAMLKENDKSISTLAFAAGALTAMSKASPSGRGSFWIHSSSAASALGQIAPGTPQADQAVAALTESLELVAKVPGMPGNVAIIDALSRFGPKAASALPRLRELERAPDPGLSAAARKAINEIAGSP
jgi:HEAT repeat protein